METILESLGDGTANTARYGFQISIIKFGLVLRLSDLGTSAGFTTHDTPPSSMNDSLNLTLSGGNDPLKV